MARTKLSQNQIQIGALYKIIWGSNGHGIGARPTSISILLGARERIPVNSVIMFIRQPYRVGHARGSRYVYTYIYRDKIMHSKFKLKFYGIHDFFKLLAAEESQQ